MPQVGVFAEVIIGGELSIDNKISLLPSRRFGIVTISDKASRGEREDESGPTLRKMLEPWGEVTEYRIIPDEYQVIVETLKYLGDVSGVDMVVTTGGTGCGPRDLTPEATMAVCERMVPGISEAMRRYGEEMTPRAILSRGVTGIRGQTLMINLPGSPRGVRESLEPLLPVIYHALDLIRGEAGECGRTIHMLDCPSRLSK